MSSLTTFIIPSIDRPTLQRAIDSCKSQAEYLVEIDRQNIGPAAIRNGLIKHATTEWVSMLDDDDTVTTDYVQRLEEEIEKNPNADLIIFREFFLWGQVLPLYPHTGWGNVGISFSIRRELAMEMPFLDQRYEDFEFIHRIERAGKNIVFSPYLTYRVRH